jgi:hypothetical protein
MCKTEHSLVKASNESAPFLYMNSTILISPVWQASKRGLTPDLSGKFISFLIIESSSDLGTIYYFGLTLLVAISTNSSTVLSGYWPVIAE